MSDLRHQNPAGCKIFRVTKWLACLSPILFSLGCPGDGSGGAGLVINFRSTPDCLIVGSGFPSGLRSLSSGGREAVIARFNPIAVLGVDLESEPPALLASQGIPSLPKQSGGPCGTDQVDSDGDAIADSELNAQQGFNCQEAKAGAIRSIDASRVALVTSGYEQLLLFDPRTGIRSVARLETPMASASFDPSDWPFWPAPGTDLDRNGFSTRACVYRSGLTDSLGSPIGPEPRCDGVRDGFFTSFTSDAVRVGNRIFVATSNLQRSSRAQFAPGTILVFEVDPGASPMVVRPSDTASVILTTGFNPTSVTAYTTPAGRDLVLVGTSGAIALGTGSGLVRTPSAIEVIDADRQELIATIPLGLAGLGYTGLSLDPSGRLALIGAATDRALFGIDLAALDDPGLGLGPEPLPIALDGSTPGYPDARIFDASQPFRLPRRGDGPPDSICTTQTSVAIQPEGRFGVATDFCDGTLSVLRLQLPPLRSSPVDPNTVLTVTRLLNVAEPLTDEATGLRGIDRPIIRSGTPGIDFTGPDVHFTAGLPRGALCGIRVEAL